MIKIYFELAKAKVINYVKTSWNSVVYLIRVRLSF